MHFLKKILAILALSYTTQTAFASPSILLTHNLTSVESNAYIDGVVRSPYPSPAHADNRVAWISVRIACTGHIVNNKCKALIKMASNTPNPIDVGWVEMDMISGDISPKELHGNGYGFFVNGPAEVTLIEE